MKTDHLSCALLLHRAWAYLHICQGSHLLYIEYLPVPTSSASASGNVSMYSYICTLTLRCLRHMCSDVHVTHFTEKRRRPPQTIAISHSCFCGPQTPSLKRILFLGKIFRGLWCHWIRNCCLLGRSPLHPYGRARVLWHPGVFARKRK